MRTTTTLVLLLCLTACGDERPGPPPPGEHRAEWVKPYDGVLPGTTEPEQVAVLRVIDERTGRPIAGAVVKRHLEFEMGPDGWAPGFEEGTTDEYGIAVIPVEERPTWSAHWVVHAKGYASTETYAVMPEEDVEMLPGRTLHGRLVDAMGRPAAGIDIGYKIGCAHAPSLVNAVTDSDGRFVLPNVAENGDVPYSGVGILVDYFEGALRFLDEAPDTVVASPAVRVRGRIVGADASDLDIRVVHSESTPRGVIARIADDGSFVLDGVERESMLDLYWAPDGDGRRIDSGNWRIDTPFVWDVRKKGGYEDLDAADDVEVRWRVVTPDGAAAEPAAIYVYRAADGYLAASDDAAEDAPADPLALDPGAYDVIVGDATSRWVAPPQRVVIEKGKPASILVQAREQPQLVVKWISGHVPQDTICGLAFTRPDGRIDHEYAEVETGPGARRVYLPAEAPARISVESGYVTRFFEVGPPVNGRRTAVVDWPASTWLHFEAPPDVTHVTLGRFAHFFRRVGKDVVVPTQLQGSVRLTIERDTDVGLSPSGTRLVELPPPAGEIVRTEPLAYAPQPAGVVRIVDAADAPVEAARVEARWWDPTTRSLHVEDFETDARGVVTSPLFRPGVCVAWSTDEARIEHRAVLRTPGPWTLRMGSARVVLHVSGPRGALEASYVLLADAIHEADRIYLDEASPAGRFTFAAVPAGVHRLVVTAKGHRGQQRRIVLQQGETRRIDVKLPERK